MNSDSLAVLVSTDCGQTFSVIYKKGGDILSTAGTAAAYFTPASNQWRTEAVNLNAYAGQQNVLIAFQNINGYGNQLYIDNVNITGTLASVVYKFTGNGNWDIASNWLNNTIPPAVLPGNAEIIIDPIPAGECVLNVVQQVSSPGKLTVKAGKKFRITGSLDIGN